MTVRLESLRVTADMDAASYVRGAQQKNAADAQMIASNKAVGQSLAQLDASSDKTSRALQSMSSKWIVGYKDAQNFQKEIAKIGRTLETNTGDPAAVQGRTVAALDGVYRKYGQVADAAQLASTGFVKLVPLVGALNAQYAETARVANLAAAAQAEIARRATESTTLMSRAQSAQAAINARLGIGAAPSVNSGDLRQQMEERFAANAAAAQRYLAALDPLSAAEARHNANVAEGARLLGLGEIKQSQYNTALANSSASLKKVADSLDPTIAKQKAMDEEAKQTAQTMNRLVQAYDIVGAAQARYNADVTAAAKLVSAGLMGQEQYNTIVAQAGRVLNDTKKAYEGAYTAQNKFGTSTGLARHEMVNFGRQAQDVFVSLASGQGVMTVLIQQVTQIVDIFATSRGTVGGFFAQIGPTLLRLLPIIGAVTAAVGGLYAAFTVSGERQTLSNSLLGGGRASGLSSDQLQELAKESAAAADITVSSSRLIAAEFVRLGAVAQSNLPQLTRLTKDYAAATGQALPDAAKELASSFSDPVRGAENLSEKLGGLDSTTLRMIRTAGDFNDKLRAQKLLMEELGRAVADAADNSLGRWERLTKAIGGAVDRLKENVAGALPIDNTSAEIIAAQRRRVAEAERELQLAEGRGVGSRAASNALEEARARLRLLQEEADKRQQLAQAEQKRGQANKQVTDAEIVSLAITNGSLAQRLKLYNEEAGKVAVLEKGLAQLTQKRNEIGVPDASNRQQYATITQQIKEQTEALEAQKKRVSDLGALEAGRTIEQERQRRATELSIKASNDKTIADAKETAAIRVQNEAYGEAVGPQLMAQRIKDAQREAAAKGVVRLNEESKAIKEQIEVTNAGAEATRRSGKAYGEIAEIRAKAAQTAAQTGGNADIIAQDEINRRIAEQRKLVAELVTARKEEASAAGAANAAALRGNMSAGLRAQLEERIRIERSRLVELESKMGKGSAEAARLAAEERDAVAETQKIRNESAAADYFSQQGQEIEALRQQRELIFATHGKRIEELEVMRATQYLRELGVSTESEIGQKVISRARELGKEKQLTEEILRIRNQIRQAQDFAADSMKSFLSDLLTGTEGLTGALKNLGKGFLNASLDALISGKGPLAGITGLASATKDGQGGFLGMLTGELKTLGKKVEQGAKEGSATGVVAGVSAVGGEGSASLFGIDGKQLAGGLTAIAGLAGAYGSGMAAGSYAQAVGGGAISGAMAGASLATGLGMAGSMALPGIGLVIGAGLAYYGQQQARKQAREQREREAQENYKNAQPAIATMRSQLRGDPQNTLKIQIAEAEAATRKLTDVMFFAKKYDEERETYLDFKKYEARLLSEYRDGFIGMIQSMEAGLGPNSPFAQAKSSVADFGKELQGFIENAETAFGQGTPQVGQARQASIAYAVSVLDGAKSLTLVQQRMQEIQGTGAGLVKVLVDLGVASEQAGEAVTAGVAMAVQRLRDTFETDLRAKTNEALDKGYLNDARSLLLEIQQLATDSRTLGTDPGNITRYFQAAAQNLVDEANLTGDAFEEFLRLFPEFTGNVVEAGRALEDASRRLGYIDRLFNATNDTSTLAGQLAAYDRQALREREEEIRLGGQYILELEAAQQAERYNIIRDFNEQANENYRQSLRQAQDYIARFTRSIQEYLDGLRAGPDSPLSPQARLAAAQSQYNAQLALAQGGDRAALDGITSYASDLLDAAKGYFASATGFQDIFAQIQSQLGALPSQISAEQFIVNAIEAGADQTVAAVDAMKVTLQSAVSSGSASEIAAALSTYFNRIDSNTSASIDFNEMRSALGGMASDSQLRDMFTRIDTDNSGSISRLEAINTATGQVRASNLNQESSLATANQIAQSVASLNSSINQNIATGNGILYEVRNATNAVNQSSLASSTYSDLIVRNLRSQAQNWGAQNVHGYAIPFFRDGGLIGGRGTGTSDSNMIMASRGEYVMRSAAVDRFGVGMLDRMNDNLALPAMPVPVMGGGNGALIAKVEALTAEIKQMRADNNQGHTRTASAAATGAMHVREGIDVVASNTAAAARAERRKAAAA